MASSGDILKGLICRVKEGMINSIRWQEYYNALKEYVAQTGHFPSKHTKLNNWCHYQRKCIKTGTMPEERRILFEELADNRMDKYNGRRFCEVV